MYKKVKTDDVFYTMNGSGCTPFITLADEYGGRVQIAGDDGCYVLYVKEMNSIYYDSVTHWFPEATRELKKLPDNARRMRRPYTFLSRIGDILDIAKKIVRRK